MLPSSKACSDTDSHPSAMWLPYFCKYPSLPHSHHLPCPRPLSPDLKIKYPCLWHNRVALKLYPEASVIIPSLPACKQQEAGERLPVAVTESVQPHTPSSAALVCCRMLTEGGKIHLQSALVPCFCCACFLCHPRIPSALSPLACSSQGCP